MAQAESDKSPTERFVDRFARRYTPVVILLAVLLAFGPPVLGYLGVAWASQTPAIEWLRRGLVLLVIACPCALVISTPVTIVSGLFRATRRGILIKGGAHLEAAGRIDAMALDKTGTFTTASPRVVSSNPWPAVAKTRFSKRRPRWNTIASIRWPGRSSPRPGGADCPSRRSPTSRRYAASAFAGRFKTRRCTSAAPRLFLDPRNADRCRARAEAAGVEQSDSSTAALVGTSESIWGVLRLADPPRPEAARAVARLRELGVRRIVMLTGDGRAWPTPWPARWESTKSTPNSCPRTRLPESSRFPPRRRCLAMVGDGVNDAPALAASRLGIALGSGASDTALETADVVVMTPDLGQTGGTGRFRTSLPSYPLGKHHYGADN